MPQVTPLRQQYLDIKQHYTDCILMFRLGDFYEMFDDDAEIAARELDLVLTGRSMSKGERVPMAGVPYHAVESYIARLIEKGYHVAVCEQITEPNGRGLVEREVTRVITPGTVLEPELLSEDKPNYLMAIYPLGDLESRQWTTAGLAYADITTGEFAVTQLAGENAGMLVIEELARLTPREVIMPAAWVERGVTLPAGIHLTPVADWRFERANAENLLLQQFNVKTLDGFGIGEHERGHLRGGRGALLLGRYPAQPSGADHLDPRLLDRQFHGARSVHAAQSRTDRDHPQPQKRGQLARRARPHRHGDGRALAAGLDQPAIARPQAA